MRRFGLELPSTLAECLAVLSSGNGDIKVVAGGTDLLPQMKNGLIKPTTVVDLSGVAELKRLEVDGDGALHIGAGVAARDLELSSIPGPAFAAVVEGAGVIGSHQVRNLATVGGNVCNAAPSADVSPGLVAMDAVAVIDGPNGRRLLPMVDFFKGVRRTALEHGEILVELVVPNPGAGSGGTYVRHTPRRELDIAVVGVASQLTIRDGRCTKARIALGAVAPVIVRATAAEAKLEGQQVTPELIVEAAEAAVGSASPISDQRGSAEYRRHLVKVLTRRTLQTAYDRATGRAASRNGAH
ncbi:MAG: xanthine dehydrogenase family protein subunit M [Chloroflexi bacterium]|nr:xanthine dehydrogenase family protein subunit M [Chloroflexota bacterium]